jgi:tetratricopeptide (TPR) repeat protein
MKSTERHQLKQDRFLTTLNETMLQIEQHRKRMLAGVVALVVIGAAVTGYLLWQRNRNEQAARMLTDAVVIAEAPVADAEDAPKPPSGTYTSERAKLEASLPKFLAVAEAFPKTQAGLAGRYHAAANLAALGRYEEAAKRYQEAAKRYQEVVDLAGDSVYGSMARLGLAEAQLSQRQFEPAINTFKQLSVNPAAEVPVDGVLMQLGRAYLLAGRKPEAVQSFKRITSEFPTSPFAAEARRELDALSAGA